MGDNRNAVRSTGDVYRHIFHNKVSSRQMAASDLGISLPTVTQSLNQLKEADLIYNAGEFESTGGRKASMYRIVPQARLAVGIDITRTHIAAVLVDLNLNILGYVRTHILYENSEVYYRCIRSHVDRVIREAGADREKVLGVGVSLPAIVEEEQNTIFYATVVNLPGDFYQRLQEIIPYPVRLFNDANSAGWTEVWDRGNSSPMVYLSLSNSVGGAILMSKVYKGENWRGAEFGHMTIVPEGRKCYCGRTGCVNAYCNASVLSDFTKGDLREFFRQMEEENNRGYRKAFDEYLYYLALAVNNLRMCFDCDVVLGGEVGSYMEPYLDEFCEIVKERTPYEENAEYVKLCHYRTEPSAVGAALFFIDQFIKEM